MKCSDSQIEHSKHCYYSAVLSKTITVTFCGVSWLTLTAISVDRLLELLLSIRYRQVVTLRRVRLLVISFWLSSFAFVINTVSLPRYCYGRHLHKLLLCTHGTVTSTFYYIHTMLHLTTISASTRSSHATKGGGTAMNS